MTPRLNRSVHFGSESGQGTVELALSLPLFALLIVGSAEIANLAWASVQVNNAARAGVAFASLSHANAASPTQIQAAAQNEAPKLITALSQVTAAQTCSCVAPDGSLPGIDCSNCAAPNDIQVTVQVSVHAPVTTLVHYPGLPATYTVSAQASMGVVQ